MKKIYIFKYTTILVMLLLLGSCEEFLDKPVEGKVDTGEVDYTQLDKMFEPVSSLYASMRSVKFISPVGISLKRLRSDFIIKGSQVNDNSDLEYVQTYNYDALKTAGFVNAEFKGNYALVQQANDVLGELDKFAENISAQSDMELNKQYKAETRMIRAMAYFNLVRYFGDIPWYDKDIAPAELQKSPRAEVYQWLIAEIKDFVNDLSAEHPNKLTIHKGALTKWAAYMLLAKAAADVQDYQTMLEASGAIVNSNKFTLYPDYYVLFKKEGELCDENIFELQYTNFGSPSGNYTDKGRIGKIQGIKTQGGKAADGSSFVSGKSFSLPTQKYVDFMVDRGETVRYTTSIIYPNTVTPAGDSIGSIPSDLMSLLAKYENENLYGGVSYAYWFKDYIPMKDVKADIFRGTTWYGGLNNVRIYRYADALLLYAEALIHNNGVGAGDAPLNLVRERANMPPITGATINDLLAERGAELACEWGCDRFHDLVRLDKTSELGPNFKSGEDEFFPLPGVQIDLQPKLAEPPVEGLFPPRGE